MRGYEESPCDEWMIGRRETISATVCDNGRSEENDRFVARQRELFTHLQGSIAIRKVISKGQINVRRRIVGAQYGRSWAGEEGEGGLREGKA